MTTFLVAVIIWVSCSIKTQGLRGLLREIASTALCFAGFLWLLLCKTVLEQSIPLHADEPHKWRVLTALHGTIWTMPCSMMAISLGFLVFKRRALHGLELWIPTLAMGYVGFIIHLCWIGGHGWEEFQYCLQLPELAVRNGISLAKITPEIIRMSWMDWKYSARWMDNDV